MFELTFSTPDSFGFHPDALGNQAEKIVHEHTNFSIHCIALLLQKTIQKITNSREIENN
jgi:hypothetical protein